MPATFLFKLRSNIDLDGDLALARLELESLLSEARPVRDLDEIVQEYPILETLEGGAAIRAYLRPGDIKAYVARSSLMCLPQLVRRLAFFQTIYAMLPGKLPNGLTDGIENVLSIRQNENYTLLVAIPHYALMELADIVARRSVDAEINQNLDGLLAYLLGSDVSEAVARLAKTALNAKITSGLLTHDLHYYKAKFFPRMARSVLTICASRTDAGAPRVLDPFVGSGTTLMEAALLGMASEGLDIDPLSVLIANQKLAALHLEANIVSQQATKLREYIAMGQGGGVLSLPPRLTFPRWLLRKFGSGKKYSHETMEIILEEIRVSQAAIQKCDPTFHALFSVLLSDAIARKLKFRFLGTGVGRFSLSVTKRPVLTVFEANVCSLTKKLRVWVWLCDRLGLLLSPAAACRGDARAIQGTVNKSYDIVLTSPPYLPAASGRESYAKGRTPSLLALGLASPAEVDALDISAVGGMEGPFEVASLTAREQELVLWLQEDDMRSNKAAPTSRYFLDIRRALEEMLFVLTPGGCAAVVTGKRSVFYRFSTREILYVAESANLLAEEAELAGFEIVDSIDLALRKANLNARPRSLDDYYETILVLRKLPL